MGKKEVKKMMTLETNRLIIRPMIPADLYFVHDYLKDPETMKYFVEGPYTVNKVRELINRNQKTPIRYVIQKRDTYEIIGQVSLSFWYVKDTYQLGFIIKKEFQNNGYGTESAKRILKYAFESLDAHRVLSTCHPDNLPSIRVIEHLNMRQEGDFKSSVHYKDSIWWDMYFYAILKEEYNSLNLK